MMGISPRKYAEEGTHTTIQYTCTIHSEETKDSEPTQILSENH